MAVTLRLVGGRFVGIYYYESKKRRFNGRPNKCFYIIYKDFLNRLRREKIGWLSEGYSAQFAENIRAERLRTLRHGEELPKKQLTFDDIATRYLEWSKNNKRTWKDDYYEYSKLKPFLGDKKLREISPFLLEKLKNDLIRKNLSNSSVNHYLAIVRQIFNKAIQWNLFTGVNPVTRVKKLSLNNRRVRFLTQEEVMNLLNETKKHSKQLYEICLISLQTGMRAGEIFNLRWQDVDFNNNILNITDPKNNEARQAYMTQTIKEILQAKEPKEADAYVFKDTKGNKIKEVSNTFKRIVKKLGFNEGITDVRNKVVFHTLRHTFASWLAINGTPIFTIKELLGHKDIKMTMRYSHLLPSTKREAVENVEKMFKEKSTKGKTIPFK
jgi:integrase